MSIPDDSALDKDWRDFLSALETHRVEYMLVGGIALGVHGHVRYTKDLDVWFHGTESNAERLIRALRTFGFHDLSVDPAAFCKPRSMLVLGKEPHAIELINFADGIDFDTCYPRRLIVPLDGIEVAVIGLDDLRANKQAVGRLQDLADLEQLQGPDETGPGEHHAEDQ
jgi:acylphosphatase